VAGLPVEKEIVLQFQETTEELRVRLKGKLALRNVSMTWFFLEILFIALLEGFLVFLGYVGGFSVLIIVQLICSPPLMLLIFFFPELVIRKLSKKNPKQNCYVKISAMGIQAQLGNQTFHLVWDYFKRVQEDKSYFFLFLPLRGILVLPKRVFTGEQENQFRTILNQNIDENHLKLKPQKENKQRKTVPVEKEEEDNDSKQQDDTDDAILEIIYTYQYEICKQSYSPALIKKPLIWMCLILLLVLILYELLIVAFIFVAGFFTELKFAIGILPGVYALLPLIILIVYNLQIKWQWKEEQLLPLERRWLFTKKGITLDKGYVKTFYRWDQIRKVEEHKEVILFSLTSNIFLDFFIDPLPKSTLDDEQRRLLSELLSRQLGNKALLKL